MPAALDKLKKKIWARLKGKTNPRTKKPYTESESWAIATAQFKKSRKMNKEILEILKELKELIKKKNATFKH